MMTPVLAILLAASVPAARPRPAPREDPVPALGAGELAMFDGGLSPSETTRLLESYLDRMTALYVERYRFPAGLAAFFHRDRSAREVFVSALDPVHDDIAKAAEILEELRALDEMTLATYIHLATAIAVVYDDPRALTASRRMGCWGVKPTQFPKLPEFKEIYDYYTDRRHVSRFGFSLDRLPWTILVHLVDNDVTAEDRRWALSRYNVRAGVAKLYSSVPYDYEKLNTKSGKLGDRPYSLPNILQSGGVCSDQAYFASRTAKSLGVPAMKVGGKGRYGGEGHCWVGYLVVRKGRPFLEFSGRYFYDYYYTGDVLDPQTRTRTLDRYVAMMYDGASLSYPKYNQSQMLIRMGRTIRQEHPAASLELAQEALKLNHFTMHGWPLLVDHVKAGTFERREALTWFNKMILALRDHPDMTFACLSTFIDCIPPGEVRSRQSLYDQAFALYGSRPDLALQLRQAQAEDLVAAGQKAQALNLLIPTIVGNAKEGALVLPATKMAVGLAKELNAQALARTHLSKADAAFPKKRGTSPSESYAEFRKLLDGLK